MTEIERIIENMSEAELRVWDRLSGRVSLRVARWVDRRRCILRRARCKGALDKLEAASMAPHRPGRAKTIEIDGRHYFSLSDAADALGVNRRSVHARRKRREEVWSECATTG